MSAVITDVNQTVLTVGAFRVTAFAEGESFKHSFNAEDWEAVSGADGSVVFVRKHNNVSTGVFRVMQGSVIHDILKGVHAATMLTGGRSFKLGFADLLGTSRISSFQTMFKKYPDEAWGDSHMPREYELIIANPKISGGLNVLA